jgi:hypothetical protein
VNASLCLHDGACNPIQNDQPILGVLHLVARNGTGSGCTTAASTLSKQFNDIALYDGVPTEVETRKCEIAATFARAQWVPFLPVTVSSVIFSFLSHEPWPKIEEFLIAEKVFAKAREEFKNQIDFLKQDPRFGSFDKIMTGPASTEDKAKAWEFFLGELHDRAQQTKRVLAGSYPPLFQKLGDNIRFSGAPLDSVVRPERLFRLMERVRVLIDCCMVSQHVRGSRQEW